MKKAVMYGAGNIGRGFIGKVFSESGYEVCFLDIAPEIIKALNSGHRYNVRIVSDEFERVDVVERVRGVYANSPQAVDEIAGCDLMATAVGVNVMKYIAENIARGVQRRRAVKDEPLNIILAENQLDADKLMRGYLYEYLDAPGRAWAEENLGLVEASIGRMVPGMPPETQAKDPLAIAVEEYAVLPVDRDGFKGDIPQLVGLAPYSPFGFYIKRKLFIHNMGHAMCAYLGWNRGIRSIADAAAAPEIRDCARRAMILAARSLHAEYGVPMDELAGHVDDLLRRFGNRALGESIERVAADPVRKLRKDDRLVGAALYVMEFGHEPDDIVKGIAAALRYDNPKDAAAARLAAELSGKGVRAVTREYMGLPAGSRLAQMIAAEYENGNPGGVHSP
jgi:mannitol-1-phosphate 5-dehydrogenase